jgi:hypothetical protein
VIRPDASDLADETYAALGTGLTQGDDEDWLLLSLVDSVAHQHTSLPISRDSDDGPGWSALVDLERAPAEGLGYLGQFRGVDLDPNLDDASQRIRIKETAGSKRGSPDAIKGAARQYLTGTREVTLYERTGSAYRFQLRTFTSETPDPASVVAAVNAQKPGGLLWEHLMTEGVTWADYDPTGLTWATMDPDVTWAEMASQVTPI